MAVAAAAVQWRRWRRWRWWGAGQSVRVCARVSSVATCAQTANSASKCRGCSGSEFLRDLVAREAITLRHVPGKDQGEWLGHSLYYEGCLHTHHVYAALLRVIDDRVCFSRPPAASVGPLEFSDGPGGLHVLEY